MIRDAGPDDAEAIAAIYNEAVLNSTAIWNDTAVDATNRRDWIAQRQAAGLPVLVVEIDGQLAGYASYGPWRSIDGFRATVEHSIYIATGFRGRGLGRGLMQALIGYGRAAEVHIMVAAIEAGNQASIKLHRELGFSEPQIMPQVGQKFGRWLDLAFMQLRLDDRPQP